MAYLLDSNVFIQAKNLYYGFDICPAFWDWIERAHLAGTVLSIDKVADELIGVDDELADWARNRPDGFFAEADAAMLPSLRSTSTWASDTNRRPSPRFFRWPTTTWSPRRTRMVMCW